MTQEWTEAEDVEFDPEVLAKESGVRVNVLVSPYDVPEKVQGLVNRQEGLFLIKLVYIGEEPTDKRPHAEHIQLIVGRNSGRLYGIEINLRALEAKHVALKVGLQKEVTSALHELSQRPISARRRDNYRLAESVILSHQEKLFSAFA